jgi:hypothetical protein
VVSTSTTTSPRDSKDPDGPALLFTPEAFASFVADVREGQFNI